MGSPLQTAEIDFLPRGHEFGIVARAAQVLDMCANGTLPLAPAHSALDIPLRTRLFVLGQFCGVVDKPNRAAVRSVPTRCLKSIEYALQMKTRRCGLIPSTDGTRPHLLVAVAADAVPVGAQEKPGLDIIAHWALQGVENGFSECCGRSSAVRLGVRWVHGCVFARGEKI